VEEGTTNYRGGGGLEKSPTLVLKKNTRYSEKLTRGKRLLKRDISRTRSGIKLRGMRGNGYGEGKTSKKKEGSKRRERKGVHTKKGAKKTWGKGIRCGGVFTGKNGKNNNKKGCERGRKAERKTLWLPLGATRRPTAESLKRNFSVGNSKEKREKGLKSGHGARMLGKRNFRGVVAGAGGKIGKRKKTKNEGWGGKAGQMIGKRKGRLGSLQEGISGRQKRGRRISLRRQNRKRGKKVGGEKISSPTRRKYLEGQGQGERYELSANRLRGGADSGGLWEGAAVWEGGPLGIQEMEGKLG